MIDESISPPSFLCVCVHVCFDSGNVVHQILTRGLKQPSVGLDFGTEGYCVPGTEDLSIKCQFIEFV